LLAAARQTLEKELAPDAPLVVGLDNSLLPKTGRRVAGAAGRRDPQGPPFQVPLRWAQRVLQFSAALPQGRERTARLMPSDFVPAPPPVKPRRAAPDAEHQAYAAAKRQVSLVALAQQRLAELRRQVPAGRVIHCGGDGGYSKKNCCATGRPSRSSIIGRIRKDSALFAVPAAQPATGRKRCYYGPQTLI